MPDALALPKSCTVRQLHVMLRCYLINAMTGESYPTGKAFKDRIRFLLLQFAEQYGFYAASPVRFWLDSPDDQDSWTANALLHFGSHSDVLRMFVVTAIQQADPDDKEKNRLVSLTVGPYDSLKDCRWYLNKPAASLRDGNPETDYTSYCKDVPILRTCEKPVTAHAAKLILSILERNLEEIIEREGKRVLGGEDYVRANAIHTLSRPDHRRVLCEICDQLGYPKTITVGDMETRLYDLMEAIDFSLDALAYLFDARVAPSTP